MNELLPCPFCGSPADLIEDTNGNNSLWYVCCLSIYCGASGKFAENAQAAITSWNIRQTMLPHHKCEPVARMIMDEGRDWWLGKLTEPIADWPNETHCLHIKTPIKEVVLGVNYGDMSQLAVLCQIVCGPINPHWIENMIKALTKKAR